jgi:hypothetical protein
MKKSIFLKSGLLIAVAMIGAISFFKSTASSSTKKQTSIKLQNLYKIANANAEGSIACKPGGCCCTILYNGEPVIVSGSRDVD